MHLLLISSGVFFDFSAELFLFGFFHSLSLEAFLLGKLRHVLMETLTSNIIPLTKAVIPLLSSSLF